MSYIKRIAEEDLLEKLSASGAVLIKGPKSLNIITGTGMSHRRHDGINVISLVSLGK